MIYAKHDSFNRVFRSPGGAISTGTKLKLSLFLTASAEVKLKLWQGDTASTLSMSARSYNFGGRAGYMHTCEFKSPDTPCLLFYCFEISVNGKTIYYCGRHGEGELSETISHSYQITVYEPFTLPDWYKRSICYQIFPDRFARGEGIGGLMRVHTHTNMGRPIFVHTDWNEEVNYLPLNHEKHYNPVDFYCGDFKGIEEKLPYLKSLSVGLLYLNPIFESRSNHRYDTANYMKADGILGGDDAFFALKKSCEENKIRLMLDGVFSHTGADSVYFNKYGCYAEKGAYESCESKYYEWYDFTKYPDEYISWWGFSDLPEVDEDNKSYREHIAAAVEKWDCSWRLDVADELTDDFIKFLRKKIKESDKENVLIGEVWEDASDKFSKSMRRGYTNGDELDGVMNYPLRQWIIDFLLFRISAFELEYNIKSQLENYPKEFMKGTLNILGSHDTVRILTVLCGAPGRDELSREKQAEISFSGTRLTNGEKKVILAVIVQFGMQGVPCIYYGDEIGMQGMADPFSRRTFNPEKTNSNILNAYMRITAAYSKNSAFSGDIECTALTDDVLVIKRSFDENEAFCMVNRGTSDEKISVSASGRVYVDYLTDKTYCAYKDVLDITLKAGEGVFLCSLE